ncbi:hypothetical protein [Campylobacter fetus]|uniref:hypothetical protein n=1 Tax=Campylobacter fetus TaxID=196 RepID=UPI000818AE23|nr:hypothetical protein [Campylobacter fetus]OCR88055.1 hypothetical protein CFT13S00388_02485 [Campylobacter fetus subsp. testudinum]RUT50996.1 hypothetical protein BWK67_00285 [Campylobacter fetus]RUT51724.1 hypothetical protein BWK51_00285 [Campylobacter fetus]
MAFKKKEEITTEETTAEEIKPKLVSKDKHSFQSLINKAKQEAFKKYVCTISYNDKRDSDKITTAYLTCENQYFSIARVVPLNIPIELEKCLINNAKEAKILLHVPEVKAGVNTGNCLYKSINKYNVSIEG